MKKVACVGILVADVIVEPVTAYPDKGVLLPVNSITMHNGGNAMTAAINLRKLGVESSVLGIVGEDIYGDFLKKRLDEVNVDTTGLKRTNKAQTSASVLMIDESGERSFFHCKGANGVLTEKDIDYSVIEKCDMVFVTGSFLLGTFDGKDTMKFLKKCKEMGKETFLDVCWDSSERWGELINMSLPYIDYFMPSIDEAKKIAKRDEICEIADEFIKNGAKNIIIKLGSKGSYIKLEDQKEGRIFPPLKIDNPVDTTGAGDSFCSGFLASYARGTDIYKCMEFANAVGAMCVTKKGATNGTKSYEETLDFIKKHNYKI